MKRACWANRPRKSYFSSLEGNNGGIDFSLAIGIKWLLIARDKSGTYC